MQVVYKFDDNAIQDGVARLNALGHDLSPITRFIAAELATASEQAFETETDPLTELPWPALSEKYKKKLEAKGKTGKMLQRSQGGLAMSLQTDYDPVSAAIVAPKIYGALHLKGGLPTMPPGPAAVKARPYMGLYPVNMDNIIQFINKTHVDAFNGR